MIVKDSGAPREGASALMSGSGLILYYGGLSIATGSLAAFTWALAKEYTRQHTLPTGTTQEEAIREQYRFWLNNALTNVGLLMYSLGKYFAPPRIHKPACVIAGIPLGTIKELSHGVSDESLKYRSKGNIFLAHQPGGSESLRISGLAVGANRYLLLIMLDTLFRWGNTKIMDMFLTMPHELDMDILDYNVEPNPVPWQEFYKEESSTGREEFHYTFPVITRQKIYTSMYIETFEFNESIEHGMDVIEYTIFLRKFEQPPPYKYSILYPSDEDKPPRVFYKADESAEEFNKLRNWSNKFDLALLGAIVMMRTGTILSQNSSELTTAQLFGIETGTQMYGGINVEVIKKKIKELKDDPIIERSVANKEELMQLV